MSTLSLSTALLVAAAGVYAGAQNAIAGGGSFITFPALLLAGLNPLAVEPWLLRARAAALLDDRVGMRRAALRATEVQPANPAAWSLLAVAYGDSPEADAAWRRVLELNKYDVRAAVALGLAG